MWKPLATSLALILIAGLAVAQPASAATIYRLGAGDQVRVKVYEWRSAVGDVHEWPALNGDFSIGADGNVSLPLIGTVSAAGLSIEELASTISQRLQETVGLATRPQASVEIVKYRPFYILGSVNHPGEYPFRPGMTVLQAVSIAGGLFRVNDPGLLLTQRGTLTTAGDLRVLQLEYSGLSARRARLQAELDDSGKIGFPPELLQLQSDPVVAQLMQQEQTMFAARRDALHSETEALNHLKNLLNSEVTSLQTKMKNMDQQLKLLNSELAGTTSLVQRGLAVAPREFELRQTELETEGRRLDLDTAALHAREEIGKADQAMIELRNKTRNEALTELAQVERKLFETAAHITTSKTIINQESTGPDLASMLGEQSGPPTYSIIRRSGEEAQNVAATEASSVEPGDTIEVKRAGGPPSLSPVDVGSSINPPKDAGARPELPATQRERHRIPGR